METRVEFKFDHTTRDPIKGCGISADRAKFLVQKHMRMSSDLAIEGLKKDTTEGVNRMTSPSRFIEMVLNDKDLDPVEKLLIVFMDGHSHGKNADLIKKMRGDEGCDDCDGCDDSKPKIHMVELKGPKDLAKLPKRLREYIEQEIDKFNKKKGLK